MGSCPACWRGSGSNVRSSSPTRSSPTWSCREHSGASHGAQPHAGPEGRPRRAGDRGRLRRSRRPRRRQRDRHDEGRVQGARRADRLGPDDVRGRGVDALVRQPRLRDAHEARGARRPRRGHRLRGRPHDGAPARGQRRHRPQRPDPRGRGALRAGPDAGDRRAGAGGHRARSPRRSRASCATGPTGTRAWCCSQGAAHAGAAHARRDGGGARHRAGPRRPLRPAARDDERDRAPARPALQPRGSRAPLPRSTRSQTRSAPTIPPRASRALRRSSAPAGCAITASRRRTCPRSRSSAPRARRRRRNPRPVSTEDALAHPARASGSSKHEREEEHMTERAHPHHPRRQPAPARRTSSSRSSPRPRRAGRPRRVRPRHRRRRRRPRPPTRPTPASTSSATAR